MSKQIDPWQVATGEESTNTSRPPGRREEQKRGANSSSSVTRMARSYEARCSPVREIAEARSHHHRPDATAAACSTRGDEPTTGNTAEVVRGMPQQESSRIRRSSGRNMPTRPSRIYPALSQHTIERLIGRSSPSKRNGATIKAFSQQQKRPLWLQQLRRAIARCPGRFKVLIKIVASRLTNYCETG